MRISSLGVTALAAVAVAVSARIVRGPKKSKSGVAPERNVETPPLKKKGGVETQDDGGISKADHVDEDPLLIRASKESLTLGELERVYIEKVFEAEERNQTRAAKTLGIARRTLYRKLREYGLIEVDD
jgi:DNA-binding NtrC family response regulator